MNDDRNELRLTEAQRTSLQAWSQRQDERDVSDDAHWWSDTPTSFVTMPESLGEMKAMVAAAFDAGQEAMKLRLREIGRRAIERGAPDTSESAIPKILKIQYSEWQISVGTTCHVFYVAEDVRAFLGTLDLARDAVIVRSRKVVRHGEPPYAAAMLQRAAVAKEGA